MRTSDFDYELPEELIAQEPPRSREDARLLVMDRAGGGRRHLGMRDLPELLSAGDVLVVNDTRVLPARIHGRRDTGGRVEVLLIEPAEETRGAWHAMVRAGGALQAGELVTIADDDTLELVRPRGAGRWVVRFVDCDAEDVMQRHGKLPLPPYIHREREDARDATDLERYQTVFARNPGAIAAPTAGLHLTDSLLDRIRARGVEIVRIMLHVGLGTFLPIRGDDLDEHQMHSERFTVSAATAERLRAARAARGRIVAVGTTTVRALEAAAAESDDGLPTAVTGRTDLFIRPGHTFRAVDALLTNFHLPRSTLLCLVSAFADRERILAAYREAVERRYRFYSYGDAMLIA